MGTRKLAVGALPETSVRLEFVGGSSSKFWQLTKTSNDSYLAEWGRIGSSPQASKVYSEHEARKKIAEKIGKGYQQVETRKMPAEQIAAKIRMDKKRAIKKNAFNFMEELRSIKHEED